MSGKTVKLLAVIGCVGLIALPSITSVAGHLPYQGEDESFDSGDWVSYEYAGTIPTGWPSWYYAAKNDCIPQDGCPHLEGVMYDDVDISEPMEAYETEAEFTVGNGITSLTTVWMVCSYDGSGETIHCYNDDEWNWGLSGELSADARELRLFPSKSASNTYHLDVFVD